MPPPKEISITTRLLGLPPTAIPQSPGGSKPATTITVLDAALVSAANKGERDLLILKAALEAIRLCQSDILLPQKEEATPQSQNRTSNGLPAVTKEALAEIIPDLKRKETSQAIKDLLQNPEAFLKKLIEELDKKQSADPKAFTGLALAERVLKGEQPLPKGSENIQRGAINIPSWIDPLLKQALGDQAALKELIVKQLARLEHFTIADLGQQSPLSPLSHALRLLLQTKNDEIAPALKAFYLAVHNAQSGKDLEDAFTKLLNALITQAETSKNLNPIRELFKSLALTPLLLPDELTNFANNERTLLAITLIPIEGWAGICRDNTTKPEEREIFEHLLKLGQSLRHGETSLNRGAEEAKRMVDSILKLHPLTPTEDLQVASTILRELANVLDTCASSPRDFTSALRMALPLLKSSYEALSSKLPNEALGELRELIDNLTTGKEPPPPAKIVALLTRLDQEIRKAVGESHPHKGIAVSLLPEIDSAPQSSTTTNTNLSSTSNSPFGGSLKQQELASRLEESQNLKGSLSSQKLSELTRAYQDLSQELSNALPSGLATALSTLGSAQLTSISLPLPTQIPTSASPTLLVIPVLLLGRVIPFEFFLPPRPNSKTDHKRRGDKAEKIPFRILLEPLGVINGECHINESGIELIFFAEEQKHAEQMRELLGRAEMGVRWRVQGSDSIQTSDLPYQT